ncbi:hypothetical protein [Roseivivax sp. THAF30]|jgi:hypothetical protein|uniref:hypothetical protein n=1 Tax=Roseivivax sp. THAF30 TaxID=2587852 RepID=UPI001268D0A3|nr:hypothetical protein [Roseivivax sp. THAF30]QFT64059.1 hypothetical protein FIU91_14055 [Roseivivax sp. THAF30]
MSLIEPTLRDAALEEEREEFRETLAELRLALRDLKEKVRAGEMTKEDKTNGKRLLDEARYWLKALRETEAELVRIEREKAGISGAWGLDLDQSREAVRCRLAKLPRCGCAGGGT